MNNRASRRNCFKVIPFLLANILLAHKIYAQYSDNLKDIKAPIGIPAWGIGYGNSPVPIGNLGEINTVVDLRGFVPMMFGSKQSFVLSATFRWYKIPTRRAVLMLYYAALPPSHIAENTSDLETRFFSNTRFLGESDVTGEYAQWCELAYKVAKDDAAPIFQKIAGSGFQGAEPITLLFNKSSVFVILNFKYNSAVAVSEDGGQVLIALEFARPSKRYKTFYNLYSTLVLGGKSGEDALAATAPYIAPAVVSVFGK